MGCWNHTCAITNLPIVVGEPVYVMLLKEQYADNNCHAHTFWRPLPFFFEGNYNDYGAVEECHGPLLDVIVDHVKNKLFEFELGENKYHDIAVKRDGFNIKMLFDADHENRLYVHADPFYKNYGVEKFRVRHIVIRKNVFDQLMEQMTIEQYQKMTPEEFEAAKVGANECVSEYKTVHLRLADYIEAGMNQLNKIAVAEEKVKQITSLLKTEEATDELKSALYKAFSAAEFDQSYNRDDIFTHVSHSQSLNHWIIDCRHLLRKYADSPEMYAAVVEQLSKMYILGAAMDIGRRTWMPATGAGSQNDSTKVQRMIADITLQEAESFDHRWNEDE